MGAGAGSKAKVPAEDSPTAVVPPAEGAGDGRASSTAEARQSITVSPDFEWRKEAPELGRANSLGSSGGHKCARTAKLKSYVILGAPQTEIWAEELVRQGGEERFEFCKSRWNKFPDGTDNIFLGGFGKENKIRGKHVLFLCNFANNESIVTQYFALMAISQAFPESLTMLVPFYPTGTMERVLVEGEVATAHTLARMLSGLSSLGKPARVMLYDLHTLQNRFYFSGNAVATLHTAFPLIVDLMIEQTKKDPATAINCVCFPDDGAEKRFRHMFSQVLQYGTLEVVVCSKKRDPNDPLVRKVAIADGVPKGRHCLIVDDLVQSGGTLHECGKMLVAEGAASVSAFVTHAVFPNQSWKKFLRGGERGIFRDFFTTDSNPHITAQIPTDDVFRVMQLIPQVLHDL